MGAKIYGSTTIGPYCKVGGEVSNSVFFGYSNKGHDGFLGNSVIGEWCNLGADTNTSNLKNNYANVKLWNYESESFINTDLQFCGLILVITVNVELILCLTQGLLLVFLQIFLVVVFLEILYQVLVGEEIKDLQRT